MTTAQDVQARKKVTPAAAARILAGQDPVIARLLAETGPPKFGRPTESHFATLVRAVVYQQLAGRAAAAIHGRLITAVGGLGIRHGYGLAWQVPTPTAKELQPLGDPYRPYRSVLAWYCWRAAELYAQAADSALTR